MLVAIASAGVSAGLQHVRAVTSFQVQAMDSCNQAVGGATFELWTSPPGAMPVATQAAAPGAPVHVPGPSGCPLQRGSCALAKVNAGCATFSTPPAGKYTIDEVVNPPNYAACQGGSACAPPLTGVTAPQVATMTVDALGNVTATVTNHAPDGSVTTAPTGGTFSGAASDPIVFHNFAFGPGSCDGDNDYDDAITGSPGVHCDSASEGGADKGFVNLTIAAPSGGLIQTGTQFGLLKKPFTPGANSTASVAVVAGAGSNPPMEVANVGGALDATVERVGDTWHQLAAPGCVDAPAAYHNHANGLLYLACQTGGGLQLGTTPMVATASGTPAPTTLSAIETASLPMGVVLASVGPAISGLPSSSTVVIFAVGTSGNVYAHPFTGGSWTAITGLADQCATTKHVAAVLGKGGAMTYVACTKVDGSAVQFATKSTATLSGFSAFTAGSVVPPFAGPPSGFPYACSLTLTAGAIADGPGAAATPGGVILTMKGSNGGMYEQAVAGTGSAVSTPQEYGPNYVGKCGANGHADPSPSISFAPGAAAWMGAAVYLAVSPATITPGGSGTVAITVLDSSGKAPKSSMTVTLSAPTGSGITFSPATVTLVNGMGSSTLSVAATAPAGAVQISGTGSSAIKGAVGLATVTV